MSKRSAIVAISLAASLAFVVFVFLRRHSDAGKVHDAQSRSPLHATGSMSGSAPGSGTQGGLSIRGTVVDERNVGVSGATINVAGQPDVTSGDDGLFAVPVAPGAYVLNAHSQTAAAGPVQVRAEGPGDAVVTLRLHRGVVLSVRVVSVTDGQPIPGARGALIFTNSFGPAGRASAVADGQGILHFPMAALGNYHVYAEADAFAPTTKLIAMNDRAGLAWDATIALEPGVVMTGRVVDETGAGVTAAEVVSKPAPRDHTQMSYRPRQPEPLLRPPVVTDREGNFRYPVPTGQNLVLSASHPRYVTGESAPLVASTEPVTLTLRGGNAVAGKVIDTQGRPVANAVVADGPPENAAHHVTRSDASGAFSLGGLDPRQREVAVFARSTVGRASPVLVDLTLTQGQGRAVELVIEHDQQLAGSVVDAGGNGVADAIVRYRRKITAPPPPGPGKFETPISGEVRADGDGAFTIDALANGEYDLFARAAGQDEGRVAQPLGASAKATAGARDVTIALPAPARITGRVVDENGTPVASYQVALKDFGGPRRVEAADGRFDLAALDPTPQLYKVKVDAENAAEGTVDARVQAGRTTDLGDIRLARGHTVHGRVLETTGGLPVANALVSVDGPDGSRLTATRTDDLGHFDVPVTMDVVWIHATASGVGGSRFEQVGPGRNQVELSLPESGRLEVSVEGAAARGEVTVTATRTDTMDGGFRVWVLDRQASGVFAGDLSPGDYVIGALPGHSLSTQKRGDHPHEVGVSIAPGQTQRLRVTVDEPPKITAQR